MTDRVLFVDDDRNITDAVKRIFHQDAIEVLTAQSVGEALSILESRDIAVVITDQRMPGRTGLELLIEVRERFPETRRIMLTGYATLELALDAINEAEVYRLLLKPCRFVELGNIVREAVGGRSLLQEMSRSLEIVKAQAEQIGQPIEQSAESAETSAVSSSGVAEADAEAGPEPKPLLQQKEAGLGV